MTWSHNDMWMLTADHSGYVKYWQSNMNNVKMFQAHKEAIREARFITNLTFSIVVVVIYLYCCNSLLGCLGLGGTGLFSCKLLLHIQYCVSSCPPKALYTPFHTNCVCRDIFFINKEFCAFNSSQMLNKAHRHKYKSWHCMYHGNKNNCSQNATSYRKCGEKCEMSFYREELSYYLMCSSFLHG